MENLEQRNILIAEFMGWKYEVKNHHGITIIQNPENKNGYGISALQFNSSWDWLIPVIKKIDSFANEEMSFEEFDNYRTQWAMIDKPSKYPIEKVFNQVAEFIKQYKETEETTV